MSDNCIIGLDFNVGTFGKSISWDSTDNLGEAEVIILGPSSIHTAKHASQKTAAAYNVENKLKEFMSSVERGLILVVLLDQNYSVIPKPHPAFSRIDVMSKPPFSFLGVSMQVKGETVVPVDSETDLWTYLLRKKLSSLSYGSVFNPSATEPLLKAAKGHSGPDKIVASYKRVGEGLVLFMPALLKDLGPPEYSSYLSALAVNILQDDGSLESVVEWENDFCFANEIRLREEIDSQNKIILQSQETIDGLKNTIAKDYTPLKKIFTSTDRVFEEVVKIALEKIGYKAVFGPAGHADLLAYDGDVLLGIEAKGILGAIKEGHISQASKWTTEIDTVLYAEPEDITDDIDLKYLKCLEDLGVTTGGKRKVEFSKGLVVCNTYCETPLDERGENFSIKVPENLTRRNICGLTGLQLLGVVLDVEKNPSSANEYRKILSETNGVFEGFEDYSEFVFGKEKPTNDNAAEKVASSS